MLQKKTKNNYVLLGMGKNSEIPLVWINIKIKNKLQ